MLHCPQANCALQHRMDDDSCVDTTQVFLPTVPMDMLHTADVIAAGAT